LLLSFLGFAGSGVGGAGGAGGAAAALLLLAAPLPAKTVSSDASALDELLKDSFFSAAAAKAESVEAAAAAVPLPPSAFGGDDFSLREDLLFVEGTKTTWLILYLRG
jgi:hypothetical protein